MNAYTDAGRIAAYLGVTLTSGQQTQAGLAADAATAWIDRYTGQSWQQVSPIADELHTILGDRLYLARRPALAITSVSVSTEMVGSAWTPLDASQYDLIDPDDGVLLIAGWGSALVKVSYTHGMTAAPADVALAATMIASSWLSQALRPNTQGLDSVSVGQNDVAVKFSSARSDVPPEAKSILAAYRTIVIA